MALQDAVYYDGYVYGTEGNFVVKMDASTGEVIQREMVAAPAFSPMRIAIHGTTLYVSIWNSPIAHVDSVDHPVTGIYPVNPTDLTVGTKLNLYDAFGHAIPNFSNGPSSLVSGGGMLCGVWRHALNQLTSFAFKVDPANLANYGSSASERIRPCDFIGCDDTYLYIPNAYNNSVYRIEIAGVMNFDNVNIAKQVLAVEPLGDGTAYCVTGGTSLIYISNFGTAANSTIDLSTIQAGVAPMRLRFNPDTGLLYIPCQNKNGIIVYDTVGGTGAWKSGFDSPIDCVFTGTKNWAVQSGSTNLMEIV